MLKVKELFGAFCLVILLLSCTSPKKNVERVADVGYTVLTDSVFTRMPGDLLCTEHYLVWLDPMALKGFIHFLDINTGKEISVWGEVGEGPKEFSAVQVSLSYPPFLQLFDLNKALQASMCLDSLQTVHWSQLIEWKHEALGSATRRIQLDINTFLALHPGATYPFTIENGMQIDSVGKYPLPDRVSNGYDVFQGELLYNPDRKCLLYVMFSFPYVAMYKYDNKKLALQWEKQGEANYQVNGGTLIWEKTHKQNFHAVTLTKNYIVESKRDVKVEGDLSPQVSGRDVKALPQSLFVYDYNYVLQKIINLKFPVLRIAGSISSDELYAVVADPEFKIIKLSVR
jgi:hypothetical protein